MFKPFIRLLAFFGKEINEIRRQPRLILSLVLGPFLILALFGVGYRGDRPILRTALVFPESGFDEQQRQSLIKLAGLNFKIESVGTDREAAMQQLEAGEIDLVQIFPADIEKRALQGQQSPIDFKYNEVNPLIEQWIEYLGYAQVNEINRTILTGTTANMQTEAVTTRNELASMREQLDQLENNLDSPDTARTRASISRVKQAAGLLALSPLVASQSGEDPEKTRAELVQLQSDLDTLDQALASGSIKQERDRIRTTRERIVRLETVTERLSTIPPDVIVSPLQRNYENLNGQTVNLMTFYVPGVIALLIQHIAITLASLSLVRERLLGAFEVFRVAPVSMVQILLGKYLGFTVFIAIITVALVALLPLLNVPFLGDPFLFAGLALLLTLASLGIGFLISAISTSESQAVQISMLVLLLSIFFSGFFLALQNFLVPVQVVGYMLPLTHGIIGFQTVMLRGGLPSALNWIALSIITIVTFGVAMIVSQIQFRKAS